MKKSQFRAFFLVSILFIFVCTLPIISWAAGEKYPSRTIEVYCAFPAGSYTDLVVRALAKGLEKYLGGTVVVINKTGGGGVVANTALVNARPDGYTLAATAVINIVSPLALGHATYSLEDFYVIGQYSYSTLSLAVHVDSPWKTFHEFLDYERKNPGVKYGHQGIGSGPYIRMENLIRMANLKMIGVPFKSDTEIVSALSGKHIPIGILTTTTAKIQEDGGQLRLLFSFDPPAKAGLSPNVPDILTVFGKGVADKDLNVLRVLIAPRKTPDEILKVLEQALDNVTKDPEFVNTTKKLWGVSPEFVDSKKMMQLLPIYLSGVKGILKP